MSSERPSKRIRQACEPCRRKKSRCPGEKPICSHCSRLRQTCHYADDYHGIDSGANRIITPVQHHAPSLSESSVGGGEPKLEDRVRLLEAKLLAVVSGQAAPNLRQEPDPPRSFVQSPPQQPVPQLNLITQKSELPSWDIIKATGEVYITYFDSQPLPLFHRQSFIQTLDDRDPELIFAMLALALRYTDKLTPGHRDYQVAGCVEASRNIVFKKVFHGTVELSTIQSLCLLSLVDFTDGNTRRASIHSSLAMNLAHNAELTSEAPGNMSNIDREERRRCFWSLFLLKRLHGADFSILDFTGEENFPYYPATPDRPLDSDERPPPSHESHDGKGIIAYALQLSQVWFKITKYARRRGKPSTLPPWSPQSEYSIILAEQMDFETRMPYIHRFRPAKFSQRSLSELNSNRDYWGPWLFLQIVYHTNLCLLNHPLLLSLRLRNFKSMIPEIFLQHTSDLITSHASWIVHLIEMLERKGFKVTDPFLGYCIAIVATIYLQESFVEDPEIRKQKKDNFHKCLSFVQDLGEQWPHVSRIAHKLHRLSETVSASADNQTTPNRNLLIDLSQFWEILEYSSASEIPGSARLLFGSTLYSGSGGFASEMAQTSPLPEPTRVDNQDFLSGDVGNGGGSSRQQHDAVGAESMSGVLDVPFVYSDEELAVLAESFFSQRGEFDPNLNNDWWNTGNL